MSPHGPSLLISHQDLKSAFGVKRKCRYLEGPIFVGASEAHLTRSQRPMVVAPSDKEISSHATHTATEKPLTGSTVTRSNFHIKRERVTV